MPSDRLLIWNVKDGWEPLCKFLGKPIPEIAIPRENLGTDTNYIQKLVEGSEFDKSMKKDFGTNFRVALIKLTVSIGLVVSEYRSGFRATKFLVTKISPYLNQKKI